MPPKPSRPWRTVLFIAAGLLIFGGIAFVVVLIAGVVASTPSNPSQAIVRTTVVDGNKDEVVAVLPIRGVILDEAEAEVSRYLDAILDDQNVKAIVLDISSPGGTVTDSNQIYERLRRFKAERQNVPIFAKFDDVAASGGYYVACAAEEIWAEETTITGSIGVLIQYPQLSGFAEKTGLKFETVVSDGSPRKDFLNTFEEPDAQDLADVKSLLNQQYDLFRQVVKGARAQEIQSAGATLDEVANGGVFVGQQAVDVGLVDHLGMLSDATAAAATAAGLAEPKIVRFGRPPSLAEQLGLAKTPVIELTVTDILYEVSAPRMLYLYNGAR